MRIHVTYGFSHQPPQMYNVLNLVALSQIIMMIIIITKKTLRLCTLSRFKSVPPYCVVGVDKYWQWKAQCAFDATVCQDTLPQTHPPPHIIHTHHHQLTTISPPTYYVVAPIIIIMFIFLQYHRL